MRKKIYKSCLWLALVLSCISLLLVWVVSMYQKIPRNITLFQGEEQVFEMGLPISGELTTLMSEEDGKSVMKGGNAKEEVSAITVNGQQKSNIPEGAVHIDLLNAVSLKSDTVDTYKVNLKLFGFIPFKQVNINVIQPQKLTPVGQPIGIYLKTDGILVVGTGDFRSLSGENVSPAAYILKTGDYITAVNGEKVDTKKRFVELIEGSKGEPQVLSVRRKGECFDVEILPRQSQNGKYKVGIWVRDNAQGIGTMTYVDESGNFGALGHGITDVDAGMTLELKSGTLYKTEIIAIKKGSRGNPGEMTGMIDYSDKNILGQVSENTECGIYGVCNENMLKKTEGTALPIALKQEVKKGKAQILCTVDGSPKYYDVKIKELHYDSKAINKGIVLEITDSELLNQTGGIVQGMSGAPIIQDGKIIGAVTHVLINDSTSGYGIFIEEMLEH